MFACDTQILQRLAFLVVCHDLAMGQIISEYHLVHRPMPWFKAQEFCQRHYVSLAVQSTEEQYFTLLNATAANKVSFWLGLQRQTISSGWKWVTGEELSYEYWFRRNYEGLCASVEAMLEKDNKLLARYCEEPHMFVCQGPVSPEPVVVTPLSSDQMSLAWNVSAFMQMTPHSYNVTTCTNTCDTFLYPYTNGSAFMMVNISNLTSTTEYFIEISAVVVRPDSVTGRNVVLQSNPTTLRVKTGHSTGHVITVILKLIKLVSLSPPLWILYRILKKHYFQESDNDVSLTEVSTQDTTVDVVPQRTRGFG